mmetsp:Transcript_7705/g.16020  ORF Transcript_7705/g.16020 Transcript_7705/m.16020 type:complete len:274 (-) Transcript_7705:587-1408(-)
MYTKMVGNAPESWCRYLPKVHADGARVEFLRGGRAARTRRTAGSPASAAPSCPGRSRARTSGGASPRLLDRRGGAVVTGRPGAAPSHLCAAGMLRETGGSVVPEDVPRGSGGSGRSRTFGLLCSAVGAVCVPSGPGCGRGGLLLLALGGRGPRRAWGGGHRLGTYAPPTNRYNTATTAKESAPVFLAAGCEDRRGGGASTADEGRRASSGFARLAWLMVYTVRRGGVRACERRIHDLCESELGAGGHRAGSATAGRSGGRAACGLPFGEDGRG